MSVQPSLPSRKVEVDFVAPEIGIVVKGFLGAFETKTSLSVCGCISLGSEVFSESHARLVLSIGLTGKMKQSRAFLSGYARQPEVELLHPWAVAFAEIFGQMVSLSLNTLSNTNLVAFEA